MTGLAITITNAGLAALTAASGSNAITIASVGLTAASFTPSADATSLPDEIKTLSTISGEVADDTTVHLSIRDETTDSYELRGFGLYLSDGTLFGIYGGGDDLIMEKAASSVLLLAVDLSFSESTATAITFGDTNFTDPPATTEIKGVVELATDAEATTGTDTARAVTPAGMLAAVSSWLNDRFGTGAPSAFVKTLLTSASEAVLRTALELKSAALQEVSYFVAATSYTAADVLAKLITVDGAGSGVDADTLDGQQGSYYTAITARLGYTPVRQGTGVGQSANQVSIGWSSANRLKVTVDSTDLGNLVFDGTLSGGTLTINGSTMQRNGYTLWGPDNDGSGSGLDADTLDGLDSTDLGRLAASNAWAGIQQHTTSADGAVAFLGGSSNTTALIYSYIDGAQRFRMHRDGSVSATTLCLYNGDVLNGSCNITLNGAAGTGSFSSALYVNGNTVWHAGNDGSGSGLDSDTLDGQHGSYYTDIPDRLGFVPVQQGGGTGQTTSHKIKIGWDGSSRLKATVNTTDIGNIVFDSNLSGGSLPHNGSTMQRNGYNLWGPDNDGSGSGLDADTLDGHDVSYFLNTGHAYVTSSSSNQSGGYRVWSDGFKECWGYFTIGSNTTASVTYPISFSSWARAMAQGGNSSSSQQDNGPYVTTMTTTGCTIYSAIDSSVVTTWRAWGY